MDEVQAHRTFSNCILTEIARYIDFFYSSSGWFDCTEHRTSSNPLELHSHRDSKVEFFYTSSGWFDWTEPSLPASLQGIEGALGTSWLRFKHIEPHRTFSNCILTERARYIDFFYTSSGWFDWPEPFLPTSLQGIEGVQGAPCTSWMRFKHSVQRTSSNLIKLQPHRDSKVSRLLLYAFGVVRLYRTSNLIEPSRITFSQR